MLTWIVRYCQQRCLVALIVSLLLSLGILVYFPGLEGPFVFDDFSNIINNDYIKIRTLDFQSLFQAANSLDSGPLGRPIAMMSFALNFYFTGGFDNTLPYKLTNLIIHLTNGLLIFYFMYLILDRHNRLSIQSICNGTLNKKRITLFAGVTAILWLLHPIQLTSVLYVVQRMASLSALFVIAGLIFYLHGRLHIISHRRRAYIFFTLSLLSFVLGMLNKENTVLMILFVLLIEYTLFSTENPWRFWRQLPDKTRAIILSAIFVLGVLMLFWAFHYASGGYAIRDFTIWERTLTEGRVLVFYLSLILVPRINAFGLYHDDIPLSTSLITPWTTLPALLILLILFASAFIFRKKAPMFCFGILWFFIGHALESTIFGLEIAHEHRNYLASLGVIIVILYTTFWLVRKYKNQKLLVILPIFLILFVTTTFVRSSQWGNINSLLFYETEHHPESPRALSDYSTYLYSRGRYKDAITFMRRAAAINPGEPGYYINMHIAAVAGKIKLSTEDKTKTISLLRSNKNSLLLNSTLYKVHSCIRTNCIQLLDSMESWLNILRKNRDYAVYDYMLGRVYAAKGKYKKAISLLERSNRLDNKYLHPLFDLAGVYMELGQLDNAERTLKKIKAISKSSRHPRMQEIRRLEQTIAFLRKTKGRFHIHTPKKR